MARGMGGSSRLRAGLPDTPTPRPGLISSAAMPRRWPMARAMRCRGCALPLPRAGRPETRPKVPSKTRPFAQALSAGWTARSRSLIAFSRQASARGPLAHPGRGVDLHVLGDDGHQFALQRGQVVRLAGVAAVAFVRQDDLQALLGDAGGLF